MHFGCLEVFPDEAGSQEINGRLIRIHIPVRISEMNVTCPNGVSAHGLPAAYSVLEVIHIYQSPG